MIFYINKKVNKPYKGFGLIGSNVLYFGLITMFCILLLFVVLASTSNLFIVGAIPLLWLFIYKRFIKINKDFGQNGFMQKKATYALPSGIKGTRINNLVKITNGKKY